MSVIYDIAGTSSDTFMLNGKLTFLQGDNDPETYQGQDGDVYFQTNGNIWTKINGIWNNLSAMSLPNPSAYNGKILYSNGKNYTLTPYSYSDVALKSEIQTSLDDKVDKDDVYTKEEADGKYVHLSGDETINGIKTFNNAIVLQNNGTTYKMTSFDSTDESANGNIVIFQNVDKNNKMTSQLHNLVNYGADNNRLCFEVNRTVGSENYNAALQFYIDKDNHFGLSATTNSSATGYSSNNNDALNKASSSISDNSFGTKGWVNNPLKSTNVVHKTGDESIGGNKTFTGTVKVPTASVSSNDTSSVNTAYINTKFQKVNVLPANPDPNVYYFIPEV